MGSSIPLPALDIKPIQQPISPLQAYAQVLGIKNQQQELQQRQAMAPLQQQEAQQQVQAGQLDLQQKQIQANDAKAMSATMQQWGKGSSATGTPNQQPTPGTPATTGTPSSQPSSSTSSMPSYDDLVPLAIKNGASFSAVQGLQAHILDMKSKAASIALDDAKTGASNADAMKTKNGMIVDAMSGVTSQPDAQLPQAITQTAQQLASQGLIDPQHLQMAQAIAQQAASDPAGARQQISLYTNSLGGFSKLLDNAQKEIKNKQDAGKSDPTSPFYAPSPDAVALGTAPGAAQIQASDVRQAARKAAAEESARLPGEMALQGQARQTTFQNTLMQHGLSQIDQYTADPQHGYGQFVSQANSVKTAIQGAKDGNQLAASMEPMMLALGVSSFAGVHRINTTEIDRAGPAVGSLYRKINNLVTQVGEGKPSDAQLNEASQIVDQLTAARHQAYVQGVSAVAANTGLDPSKVQVFDQGGNLASLKSLQGQQQAQTSNASDVVYDDKGVGHRYKGTGSRSDPNSYEAVK